jgi:hypothetical protein
MRENLVWTLNGDFTVITKRETIFELIFIVPRKDKVYDSGKEKQFKEKLNRTFENKKLQI